MSSLGHAAGSGYRRSGCRVCGERALDLVLDLGSQPLANAFLRTDELGRSEPRYPLELCRCPACGHLQLSVTVSPELMFRNYVYASGVSESFRAHVSAYAEDLAARFLPDHAFVVEFGSNDGILLQAFDPARTRVLGIEPATNIAARATAAGVETLNEFFGESVAKRVASERGRADAIVANNVVAHIDDLGGLVAGVDALLGPAGVFVAEFPYLGDFIERTEYDTIYHEHLSYFSARAVLRLFEGSGLAMFDVRRSAIHGGSLRIFVGRGHTPTVELTALLAEERSRGLDREATFREFAGRVRHQRDELTALLDRLAADGRRLAAYGAAAKGSTLLNYCSLDSRRIEYIADRSSLKIGLYAPGSRIPVRDAATLAVDRPDDTLLLAWNFESEIAAQQAAYLAGGGRFIVPIPLPHIVAAR